MCHVCWVASILATNMLVPDQHEQHSKTLPQKKRRQQNQKALSRVSGSQGYAVKPSLPKQKQKA